jgi:hypothetical protein
LPEQRRTSTLNARVNAPLRAAGFSQRTLSRLPLSGHHTPPDQYKLNISGDLKKMSRKFFTNPYERLESGKVMAKRKKFP